MTVHRDYSARQSSSMKHYALSKPHRHLRRAYSFDSLDAFPSRFRVAADVSHTVYKAPPLGLCSLPKTFLLFQPTKQATYFRHPPNTPSPPPPPHTIMAQQQQLWSWFMSVDTDRSGNINSMELQRALQMGGLNFSLALCQQLIRMHDRDGSGTISFDEFASLHQWLINTQNAYYMYDRDRSGFLSPDEVFQGLTYSGYRFDQAPFAVLLRTFDPDRNGRFSMAEFIAMSAFLQSATNVFKAFDNTCTGRVSLDFNQFLYAAANCR